MLESAAMNQENPSSAGAGPGVGAPGRERSKGRRLTLGCLAYGLGFLGILVTAQAQGLLTAVVVLFALVAALGGFLLWRRRPGAVAVLAFGLIFTVFGGLVLFGSHIQAGKEASRLEELRARKAANFAEADRLLAEGKADDALALLALVEEVDPGFAGLAETKTAAEALAGQQKRERLLAEVEATPESEPKRKAELYAQLGELEPDNQDFQRRFADYDARAQELAERSAGERAEAARRAAAQLELIDWHWSEEHGYLKAEGRVRNLTDRPLRRVQVVVTYTTSGGDLVKHSQAMVDYDPILPGQVSPWSTITTGNPAAARASVDFKELFGGSIPWVE